MRYERILAEVLSTPWAVHEDMLATITDLLIRRVRGDRLTDEEIEARISAGQVRAAARGGGARVGTVAVMPILGVMLPRSEAMERTSGAVSTQALTSQFDALVADPTVSAIVLDFDSPGGSAGGVEEFAMRVSDATAKKPVVALAAPMMASAAYWIGSAASELLVTPSALIGSIGVYAAHEDISAALERQGVKVSLIAAGAKKVLGNPFEPLSDEGRAEIKKRVDEFYGMFVKAVARGRGVAQRDVRDGFGQGGVVGAQEAVDMKMADRIGTLDDAIALAAKRAGVRTATRAEGDGGVIAAEEHAHPATRLADQARRFRLVGH